MISVLNRAYPNFPPDSKDVSVYESRRPQRKERLESHFRHFQVALHSDHYGNNWRGRLPGRVKRKAVAAHCRKGEDSASSHNDDNDKHEEALMKWGGVSTGGIQR